MFLPLQNLFLLWTPNKLQSTVASGSSLDEFSCTGPCGKNGYILPDLTAVVSGHLVGDDLRTTDNIYHTAQYNGLAGQCIKHQAGPVQRTQQYGLP